MGREWWGDFSSVVDFCTQGKLCSGESCAYAQECKLHARHQTSSLLLGWAALLGGCKDISDLQGLRPPQGGV